MAVLLAGFWFGGVSLADGEIDISSCSIIGLKEDGTYLFSGVAVTPTVWVVCVDESLEEPDKYYTVDQEYYDILYTDNDKIWIAKITVTGKNWYTWTLEKTFELLLDDSVVYTIYTPLTDKYTYNFVDPTADKFNSWWPIKLYKDVTLNKSIAWSLLGWNKTVDLNWHSITVVSWSPFISATKNTKEWTFNIIDTSENKWWKIIVTDSENAILVNRKNMNLTIWEWVIIEWWKISFVSEGGKITVQGKFTDDVVEYTDEWYYSVYDGEKYYEVTDEIWTLTSFFMSSEFLNAEFKVILNEGWSSIDLWKTKAYLNKELSDEEKTASTLYQWLINKTDTDWIEVIEVEWEKLLFINNTINHRTDVFRSSTTWKFSAWTEFVPTKSTDYPSEWLVYETTEGFVKYPSWVSINQTPTKYNEIKDGNAVIWYTLLTNWWFYAPRLYIITFNPDNWEETWTLEVLYNAMVSKPEIDPTKEWYIFQWWFNGDNKYDFTAPVTENITLIWKWETIVSQWDAKIDDETDEWTWMVVEADVPAIETAASAVQSSNSTATVQWEVELNVYNDANWDWVKEGVPISDRVNFTKAVLVRIPVNSWSSVKIKVKHNWVGQTFGIDWLATASVDCNNWVASSNVYDGSARSVNSWYAEIWTCSASTFVAYTEVTNPTSSSSTSWWWSGGGWSSRTSALDDTKATTWNNAKLDGMKADETKLEENNDGDGAKTDPMIDVQAVEKFGQEQIDAYKWALENGITTMKTVEEARLDEPLTRAELAKMMVVYIQKVLEKSPVVTWDVNYPDVKVEEIWDLVDFVKLAYQYQIMWINANGAPIELFNPHGIVSRWEYATVFSRVLFGAKFNKEGVDFYTNHLEALKSAGILTNTLPTIQEMRGWVMLMMYRSSQNGEAIEKVANSTEEIIDEAKAEEIVSEETVNVSDEEKSEGWIDTEETTKDSTEESVSDESSETPVNTAEATTWDALSE